MVRIWTNLLSYQPVGVAWCQHWNKKRKVTTFIQLKDLTLLSLFCRRFLSIFSVFFLNENQVCITSTIYRAVFQDFPCHAGVTGSVHGQDDFEADYLLGVFTMVWLSSTCSKSNVNLLNTSISENTMNSLQKLGFISASWRGYAMNLTNYQPQMWVSGL